jgi:hypothetical protein
MTGGGSANSGRCVAEVVVDGAAEVEIRGDTANLRDLSGRPPEWRRFECTSAIPPNAQVRLNASGRGGVALVGSPNNGGPAVVRIQDAEGGASTYQFELTWSGPQNQGYNGFPNGGNQGYPPASDRRESDRSNGGYQGYPQGPDRRDNDRSAWGNGRFSADQAVNVCRDAVRQQAMDRFGTRDININQIHVDDNPGRRDWVVGMMEVRQGSREQQYPFSCSVNLENGRVRTANIDAPNANLNRGYAARDAQGRAMETCQNAVVNKMGEGGIRFSDMSMDEDGDLVTGRAEVRGRWYDVSCRVGQYGGSVRDVEVRRR